MKKFKIHDIVYTFKEYRWHQTHGENKWHNVPANEAFEIDSFENLENTKGSGTIPYVELINIKEGYHVLMKIKDFHNRFDIKQIRKQKLKKLNENTRTTSM